MICCAHHPLFSNGAAADNGILQQDWGTLFKKHTSISISAATSTTSNTWKSTAGTTSFVLAGGGGAHAHPMLRYNRGPFSRSVYGFAHFQITRSAPCQPDRG